MSMIDDIPVDRVPRKRQYETFENYLRSDTGLRRRRVTVDPPFKKKRVAAMVLGAVASVQFQSDHQAPPGTKVLRPTGGRLFQRSLGSPAAVPPVVPGAMFFTNFAASPGVFAKPEWVAAPPRNHPVSHTKNLPVTLAPTFQVNVIGAAPGGYNITQVTGQSTAWPFLTFNLVPPVAVNVGTLPGGVFAPGAIVSMQALPNWVMDINWPWSIQWTLTINGAAVNCGLSGPHEILVTFNAPGGQMVVGPQSYAFPPPAGPVVVAPGAMTPDVTVGRLRLAIAGVWFGAPLVPGFNPNVEQHHVDALFRFFGLLGIRYNLGYRWNAAPAIDATYLNDPLLALLGLDGRPAVDEYLWMCAAGQARGECHVIAAALGIVCRGLGIQGNLEIGRLWPWPRRAEAPLAGFPPRAGDPNPPAPLAPAYAPGLALPLQPYLKGRYSVNDLNRYKRSLARTPFAPGMMPYMATLFIDTAYAGNNFEGVLRYGPSRLYAIGEVILGVEANLDLNATIYYANRTAAVLPANIQNSGWIPPFWPNVPPPGPLFFINAGTGALDATPYPTPAGSALGHLNPYLSWQD